jgi:serine phosphatase RsbU (regulator of sigma subunit)
VAAFVAVAIVGPIWGIHQLDTESTAQVNLSAAREGVDAVLREQLSEETGLRGYVATHDRYFLDPDGPPNPQFTLRVDELARLVKAAGVDEAVPLVYAIGKTHDQWELDVALPLLENPARPDSLRIQTSGKILTDKLRAASQQLRELLSAASMRVQLQLSRTINLTVAISAAIVAMFALAAVTLGLSRATAVERLQREHSLVEALQGTLRIGGARLPRTETAFAYASATAEARVGGDLLDSWRDSDDTGWFLIADASGKGIQAARHAAFVQYAVRALAADSDEPGTVVQRFNRLFIDTFEDPAIFVVLFLGRYDSRTRELCYVGAGHSAAFLRRGTSVALLPPTGPIAGLERDTVYSVGRLVLPIGATVVLATDGLTEARDDSGTFLGDDGVASLLEGAPLDPQGICDLLVAEAERRYNGVIADDMAILAMTVLAHEDGTDTAFSTMEADPPR